MDGCKLFAYDANSEAVKGFPHTLSLGQKTKENTRFMSYDYAKHSSVPPKKKTRA